MVYGESGSGKTFWCFDIAMKIAQKTAREDFQYWLDGHKIMPGKVLYVAAEDPQGCKQRAKAYAKKHNSPLEDFDIHFISDCPNLHQGNDFETIRQNILDHGGGDVIIIDTLARVSPGANENSGEDMGPVIEKCENLALELGGLVILIHHSGKDSTRGARGWSGLKAPLVTEIEISKKNEQREVKFTKQKNGSDGQKYKFKLIPVRLCFDEDGDEVTSCVVEYCDDQQKEQKKPRGEVQQLLLEVAHKISEQSTTFSPAELLDETKHNILTSRIIRRDNQKDS